MTKRDPFKYFHGSPEIIHLVVMMYVRSRFHFGPLFAAEIRRNCVQNLRAYSNWQWHLDDGAARQGMFTYLRGFS